MDAINTSTAKHKITVCISCRPENDQNRPGFDLIKKLRRAIASCDATISDNFQISGAACMAGCDRPCTIAYQANHKATYLFGDIDPVENIDDLIAFAHQYANLDDGWCSSSTRPEGLDGKTLARVPSSFVATQIEEGASS